MPPSIPLTGDAAAPVEAETATPTYKNPFLWVPSSYLTMGLIYVAVGTVANIMFRNMGMENDKAAFWSSSSASPTPSSSSGRRRSSSTRRRSSSSS